MFLGATSPLNRAPFSRMHYVNEPTPPPITRLLGAPPPLHELCREAAAVCGAAARRSSLCVLCSPAAGSRRVLPSIMRYFSTFIPLDFQFVPPKTRLWGC